MLAQMERGPPLTCRARLLAASKSLFARLGYEQSSTAAIAREAGTSESQLVRYFETKVGLLRALFEESWKPLNRRLAEVIAKAGSAREAMVAVAGAITQMLGEDPELACLFLLESRRVRGSKPQIMITRGFLAFRAQMEQLVLRGQADGSFSKSLSDAAIASALSGAAEGMIRDRLVAERTGNGIPFSEEDIEQVFTAVVDGFAPRRPGAAPRGDEVAASAASAPAISRAQG